MVKGGFDFYSLEDNLRDVWGERHEEVCENEVGEELEGFSIISDDEFNFPDQLIAHLESGIIQDYVYSCVLQSLDVRPDSFLS